MAVTAIKAPRARPRTRPSPAQAARTVGERLRALRTAQQVTLVQLAKAAGVDAATVSRIETGKMTGTLESHMRLAAALGAKITDLYAGIEEARTREAVSVLKPSAQGEVYVHQAGKASLAMLTTDVLRKKLMPVLITIEPGGSTHKEEAKVGTERFLYVLDGELEARIGDATHEMKKGGTLYFDASIPHKFRNVGRRTVKCLSITTPPVL